MFREASWARSRSISLPTTAARRHRPPRHALRSPAHQIQSTAPTFGPAKLRIILLYPRARLNPFLGPHGPANLGRAGLPGLATWHVRPF